MSNNQNRLGLTGPTVTAFAVSFSVLLLLYLVVYPNRHFLIPESFDAIGGLTSGSSATIKQDGGLRALCDETEWTEGLWIHCHSHGGPNGTSMNGGLNNARNRVQTCLRLAIDAGASLVISTAMTRSPVNLVNTNDMAVCPDTFWNIANLQKEMRRKCPQLKLRDCGDLTGIPTILKTPHKAWNDASFTSGQFREFTQNYLDTDTYRINTAAISPSSPVVIEFSDSFKGWNYRKTGELATIRKGLFRSLEYNADLLSIGSQILQSAELKDGYIGIHLRGESDWPSGFGSGELQMALYTAELERLAAAEPNLQRTVYVSCGSESAIQTFREKLSPLGFTVYDKMGLLSTSLHPEKQAEVEAMNFDQKAIVEYVMLVSADRFMGVVMSTFSSIVAFARTVDEEGDFFDEFIFPGSVKAAKGMHREYPDGPALKGDGKTMLLVVSGDDVMDEFP